MFLDALRDEMLDVGRMFPGSSQMNPRSLTFIFIFIFIYITANNSSQRQHLLRSYVPVGHIPT